MSGRTISFPKGAGSLNHNNRVFISDNVHEERTPWNRTYIRETLEEAYEKCFGDAVREYNAGQKRNDRKIKDYYEKIKYSDNKEKLFYENVVQLGDMYDTPVVDGNGNMTQAAKEAVDLLEEYVRTFSERNPNLYMFNCVLHLDESTPHLHIDYIPMAHGYKTGMKTRNSLSKAFQQMGFDKGRGQYDNEAIHWEAREREYLMELCRERGIEVEIKGDKRDNLTLPEYKAAMRKVESLEAEAEKLDMQNGTLEQENENLAKQAEELAGQIEKMELEKSKTKKLIEKQELTAETLKVVSKEVDAEMGKVKSAAVPINSLFGGEEYVKIKKSDWSRLTDAFRRALSVKKLVEQYEKKITNLNDKLADLEGQVEKLNRFLDIKGLGAAFEEFLDALKPKKLRDKINENKVKSRKLLEQRREANKDIPVKRRNQQEVR